MNNRIESPYVERGRYNRLLGAENENIVCDWIKSLGKYNVSRVGQLKRNPAGCDVIINNRIRLELKNTTVNKFSFIYQRHFDILGCTLYINGKRETYFISAHDYIKYFDHIGLTIGEKTIKSFFKRFTRNFNKIYDSILAKEKNEEE